jgi:hypothetical protein
MKKPAKTWSMPQSILSLHDKIMTVNQSKIFAGIVIIVLNISSKFVTIKLSNTMEAYLKYTFSRNVLIFAMAWMGTRDIYIALLIMLTFIILMDYLLNEGSYFCCLPSSFMSYHEGLRTNNDPQHKAPSQEQISDAIEVLNKLKKSNEEANGKKDTAASHTQNVISVPYS